MGEPLLQSNDNNKNNNQGGAVDVASVASLVADDEKEPKSLLFHNKQQQQQQDIPCKEDGMELTRENHNGVVVVKEEEENDSDDRGAPEAKVYCSVDDSQTSESIGEDEDGTVDQVHRSLSATLCRLFLIDTPLALIFLLLLVLTGVRVVTERYLTEQMEAMYWSEDRKREEGTYYSRICNDDDVTARDVSDLYLPENATADDAMRHILRHGIVIFPDLLTEDTMDELRDFIVDRNYQLNAHDAIYVIENENRYSFGIGANEHPAVAKMLHQLATHPKLRPAIDKIIEEDAAVIEFTAITSAYGAVEQHWHADVAPMGSAGSFARSFLHSYSIFIPLQDTTQAMGATGFCPGTHYCTELESYGACFQAANAAKSRVWKRGHGALFNAQLYHHGTAHMDPHGKDRVLLIMTLAQKPKARNEKRILGQGGTYSTRSDMWGFTMKDMEDAPSRLAHPWQALRSWGIYNKHQQHQHHHGLMSSSLSSVGGWTFPQIMSMRISNGDPFYTDEDLDEWLERGGLGLPDFLSGYVPPENTESRWSKYLFSTLIKCELFIKRVNVIVLCTYVGFVTLVCVLKWILLLLLNIGSKKKRRRRQRPFLTLRRALVRLLISHLFVLALFSYTMHGIQTSDWAKDLEAKRLYTSPYITETTTSTSTTASSTLSSSGGGDGGETTTTRKQHYYPTTFPNTHDVLIGTRFDSDYLYSYKHFLDTHPGNYIWKQMMAHQAKYYSMYQQQHHHHQQQRHSYHSPPSNNNNNNTQQQQQQKEVSSKLSLPPAFAQAVVDSILERILRDNQGRFLLQDNSGNWGLVDDNNNGNDDSSSASTTTFSWSSLAPFGAKVTRKELVLQNQVGRLLPRLHFATKHLLSECRYGILQETAMMKKHAPVVPQKWQKQLLLRYSSSSGDDDDDDDDTHTKDSSSQTKMARPGVLMNDDDASHYSGFLIITSSFLKAPKIMAKVVRSSPQHNTGTAVLMSNDDSDEKSTTTTTNYLHHIRKRRLMKNSNKKKRQLQAAAMAPTPLAWLKEGDGIEVRGTQAWHKGTIVHVGASTGEYTVKYDSDGAERKVSVHSEIRRANLLSVGDVVRTKLGGGGDADDDDDDMVLARVLKVHQHGGEDDDDDDDNVDFTYDLLVRSVGISHQVPLRRISVAKQKQDYDFQVGDRVEAQYRGKAEGEWYRGTIVGVHVVGGTASASAGKVKTANNNNAKYYHVDYGHGLYDRSLPWHAIRPVIPL